jgi:hypothetical protein
MAETYTVRVINTLVDRYSGIRLTAGQTLLARDSRRAFAYSVQVNGEWYDIDADNASVLGEK